MLAIIIVVHVIQNKNSYSKDGKTYSLFVIFIIPEGHGPDGTYLKPPVYKTMLWKDSTGWRAGAQLASSC